MKTRQPAHATGAVGTPSQTKKGTAEPEPEARNPEPAAEPAGNSHNGDAHALAPREKRESVEEFAASIDSYLKHVLLRLGVKQYQTVWGGNARDLDDAVNAAIKNEWQPFGSPYTSGRAICQAMVKL